jgi:hypothetical protein
MKKFILLLAISIWILPATLHAQCDTIASLCVKNLTAKYISDGQQYRALLLSKEVAEFNATFYGGTTYRLAACSGLKDGSLEFRVFDKQRNLLFTNIEHKNAPYWDFKFESTMDCIIEAQLIDPNEKSGCAVLLISFKK